MIRSAQILRILAADPAVDLAIINTGQHYDQQMMSGFLEELEVPAAAKNLEVGSDDAVTQTATCMNLMGVALADIAPQCVCVFGDTNSTLAGGLASVKAGIPLVHIEAGCRSYDLSMPEEVNRRAVDHVADVLLAVSERAARNLTAEAVLGSIEIVGDPQFDVFLREQRHVLQSNEPGRGLLTLHRQENVDNPDRLDAILDEIAVADSGVDWIFPVHPRTRRTLPTTLPANVRPVEPLLYRELLAALATAPACVTDSGGLQKEAFWARVPCVTIRSTTEWPETVEGGANRLAQPGSVAEAVSEALGSTLPHEYENPYGDGHGSEQIAGILAATAWRTAERQEV